MAFNNFSPRLGLTYDLTGNGKTVARANYARYYGQVGNGARRRHDQPGRLDDAAVSVGGRRTATARRTSARSR